MVLRPVARHLVLDLLVVAVPQVSVLDLRVITVQDLLGDFPRPGLIVIQNVIVGVDLVAACDIPGSVRKIPAAVLHLLVALDGNRPLPGLGIHIQSLGLGHHQVDQQSGRDDQRDKQRKPAPARSCLGDIGAFSFTPGFLTLLLTLSVLLLALEVVGFTLCPCGAAGGAEFVVVRIKRVAVRTQPVRILIDLVRILHILFRSGHIKGNILAAGFTAFGADLDLSGDPVRAAVIAVPAADHYFSHIYPQYCHTGPARGIPRCASRPLLRLHFIIIP